MRTYGAKNADHQAKRAQMVAAIAPMVLAAAPNRPSLREMSKAAGVSVNNLRHYFGTRECVLEAVFQAMRVRGEAHIQRALAFAELPVAVGLRELVGQLVESWTPQALGGLHCSGISEGVGSESLGPAYIDNVLEPTVDVVERMLAIWQARGEIEVEDLRTAALAVLAPVVLALLHQRGLGGHRCRPLDFEVFLDHHVAGFLRGYGVGSRLP